MLNQKLENNESIALIFTIIINHIFLVATKSILSSTHSSAILNGFYITLIAIVFSIIILKLLNAFPKYDILDISNYIGGKVLKFIVGALYIIYFSFFTAILLRSFSNFLQVVYYPLTKTFFIILLFIISATIVSKLKNNALIRANLLIFVLTILSIIFLFVADYKYFTLENFYPILGDGLYSTFIQGISNLFAFQGLCYIFFLPTHLKNPEKIKKITLLSMFFSGIYLLLSIAIILFMFNAFIDTGELMPLYSAVRYIEFGSFVQRLDSVFLFIWILSFISYLSIVFSFCTNIFQKITNKNSNIYLYVIAILTLIVALLPKNYAVFIYLLTDIYKYSFLILGITFPVTILLIANFKKKIRGD